MKTKHFFSALLCASVVIGLMGCRNNTGNGATPIPTPDPIPTDFAEKIVGTWKEYRYEGFEEVDNVRYVWNRNWDTNIFIDYQIDLTTNTQMSYDVEQDGSHIGFNEYVFYANGEYVSNEYLSVGNLGGTTSGTWRIVGSTLYTEFMDPYYGNKEQDEIRIISVTDDEIIWEVNYDTFYNKSYLRRSSKNEEPDNTGKDEQTTSEGMLAGSFSVSNSAKVHFSQGNLQYQASTNTWRFAERQYDVIGEGNANISSTYSGWIDLFGWGTGYNPTNTSTDNKDYPTFVDWGVNSISNGGNAANQWRTLTTDEWQFLFRGRTNAEQLFGLGSVNGVNGLILLPDNWTTPVGVTFVASTTKGLTWDYNKSYYHNDNYDNFDHNTYSATDWLKMEAVGAVFLPAADLRWGAEGYYEDMGGDYWSSTPYIADGSAFSVVFSFVNFYPQSHDDRVSGCSVRLVR